MIPNLSDAEGHTGRLKTLLEVLAYHIDECDNKAALASLSRQYQLVLEKLSELEDDEPEERSDSVGSVIANVVNLR